MLLVLVGNATSSTSLVTEQEGLTWLHASTRARTHANAKTHVYTYVRIYVRNTYVRTVHDATRGVSSTTRSVSYLELKPLKCDVVFCGRHYFVARGDEYHRAKIQQFPRRMTAGFRDFPRVNN